LPESNIRFNAADDLENWTGPGYAEASWKPAQLVGLAPCAPFNRLVKRPIPLWRDGGIQAYSQLSEDATPDGGRLVKGRLPYNAQVTPYLKIDAPAGASIDIRTDEYMGGGAPNVRAEYVTKAGVQDFACFGWMNGHQVEYRLPAGVKVLQLGFRESGYATEATGTFDCDDDFINRLRKKAVRTLYLTMRDTYMDCPDRERSQWWGDVVNELGEVFYAFDRSADALTRKGMIELVGWQKPSGVLFSPVPAGNWEKDLPLQMLASVGRQGFWTYALYSGDLETLRVVYPGVKRYLEIWDMQSDGLVQARPGAWPWGDWGDNIDMPVLTNAWYYLALQGQRRMAEVLGHLEDLSWIDTRLTSIERTFNRTYWNGHAYRSPNYPSQSDDRANALAVVAGLARPEQYADLLQVFQTQEHASPYMEKYVLEALCLMNQPAAAQARMKRRYARMVEHPEYTTLWEGWGIGAEGFGGGTINHAWSGGALTIMSQYFAGIAPTQPGFSSYRILPQPGDLRRVAANVVSPRGPIRMQFHYAESSLSMDVDSPVGTTAVVGLPLRGGELIGKVKVNGRLVWENGRATRGVRGVRAVGLVAAPIPHLEFEVQPGYWRFDASIEASKLFPVPTPVWSNAKTVSAESLFFVRDPVSGRPRSKLLFKPSRLLAVRNSSGDITFPLADFVIDGRTIEYVGSASFPAADECDLVVDEKTNRSIANYTDGKRFLLFSEGRYFHDRQLAVDYSTRERWSGPVPEVQALPRLGRLIAEKRPIRIAVIGDSISTGANASSSILAPPFQPAYPDLLKERIKTLTGQAVTLSNLSVGGKTSVWGLTRIDAVVAENPDVIVIAFGMNDASGKMPYGKYKQTIQAMIERARLTLPEVEFVLVAGMSANPDWDKAGIPFHAEHQRALLDLAASGIVICDVGVVWDFVVQRKGFLSVTGNGVNHPNDYGHRLYTDCLVKTLLGK
jgi:hypothetical protein